MAWKILNVSLEISDTNIPCKGGKAIAIVTVKGKTDDEKIRNQFKASLRDDHVIPDILWDSGPQWAGPGETVQKKFEVELWCNSRCKVVGPAGSSHEKIAEVYALVAGEEREGQSDDIAVTCI